MTKQESQARAQDCLRLAAQMKDREDRLRLLLLANDWLRLANSMFPLDEVPESKPTVGAALAATTALEEPE